MLVCLSGKGTVGFGDILWAMRGLRLMSRIPSCRLERGSSFASLSRRRMFLPIEAAGGSLLARLA